MLLQEFLNKSATDLALKVGEVSQQQDPKEQDVSDVSRTDLVQSLFDNNELLIEVVACGVNLTACIAFVSDFGRAWQDDLTHMVGVCLEQVKM